MFSNVKHFCPCWHVQDVTNADSSIQTKLFRSGVGVPLVVVWREKGGGGVGGLSLVPSTASCPLACVWFAGLPCSFFFLRKCMDSHMGSDGTIAIVITDLYLFELFLARDEC